VPPDHPESNFGVANRTLIRHVPIPASHVHRMRGERPAVDAGREYDVILRARRDERPGPLFDVTLLGIGADAHIASIFPESPLVAETSHLSVPPWPVLQEHDELAAGVWVPKLNQWRITQTPPALLDSTAIIVMAAGSTKADAIAAAFEGALNVSRYPAQLLRAAEERVDWIIDAAAARSVSPRPMA
jgi:6-phosphogluconolactonase